MKSTVNSLFVSAVLSCTLFICTPGEAAVTLDLTGATTEYQATTGDGHEFVVTVEDVGSSGTGLINPFLRLQSSGNEQGFNSDRNTALFDEGVSQTTSLSIDTVPTYTAGQLGVGGTSEYGEFLLDTNETTFVSLNQLQIFAATESYATNTNLTNTGFLADAPLGSDPDGTPVITFDPTQTIEIFRLSDYLTQYEVIVGGGGSGTYDLRFFFDVDLLASLGGTYTHFIVYSQFGSPPGSESSGSGFEEWSVSDARTQVVPEPSTWALLLITACGGLVCQYRNQRKLRLATAAAEE